MEIILDHHMYDRFKIIDYSKNNYILIDNDNQYAIRTVLPDLLIKDHDLYYLLNLITKSPEIDLGIQSQKGIFTGFKSQEQ